MPTRFDFWLGETHKGMNVLAANIAVWRADKGFDTNWMIVPEKLMLVVSELGEAMEAYRHLTKQTLNHLQAEALPSDTTEEGKWPDIEQSKWVDNFREEIADTLIRLLDLAGSLGIDVDRVVARKMVVNEGRPTRHGKEC